MKNKLFLTGKDTLRSSDLLRTVLGERMSFAGGYITERSTLGEDDYEYRLYPACHACGISGLSGERFYHFSYISLDKNTEVFRTNGVQLLSEALWYPYAVLDHFGGFELLIPEFRSSLEDLLNSDVPVIGVLLSRTDVEELKCLYGLGNRLDLYLEQLHRSLSSDSGTQYLLTDGKTDEELCLQIRQWAERFAVM